MSNHFIKPPPSNALNSFNTEIADITDDEDEIDLEGGATINEKGVDGNGNNSNYLSSRQAVNQDDSSLAGVDHKLTNNLFTTTSHSPQAENSPKHKLSVFVENDAPTSSDVTVLKGIFDIDGKSYDVRLYRSCIVLELIGNNRRGTCNVCPKIHHVRLLLL